jgi:hypothetical protein
MSESRPIFFVLQFQLRLNVYQGHEKQSYTDSAADVVAWLWLRILNFLSSQ